MLVDAVVRAKVVRQIKEPVHSSILGKEYEDMTTFPREALLPIPNKLGQFSCDPVWCETILGQSGPK